MLTRPHAPAARTLWRALAASVLVASTGAAAFADATLAYLKIEEPLVERDQTPQFLLTQETPQTLRSFVTRLERLAADPDLEGVVIRIASTPLSLTQAEELGAAIRDVRAAGKKVHLFTEIYEQPHLVLGSYCDDVIVQQGGAVSLPGIYMEEMFLAGTLRWMGVEPDFVQIGDYKGAKEMFANTEPSPQWNENVNQLLDGIYGRLRSHLRQRPQLSEQELDQAMAQAMFLEPEQARSLGLVDAVVDRLSLDEHLRKVHGPFTWNTPADDSDKTPDFASMGFFEVFSELMNAMQGASRSTTRDTIAVVHIDGAIVDGESSAGGLMGGSSVGSLTIRETLKKIEDDRNVRGVIVRVNSPGGSAIASESIWIGLRRIAENNSIKRPVWTSVGNMAASGGYYIAVAGEKIYLNPSSIVGSIGVVGGKLALGGLYEKLHMNVVPRARGPMAEIMGAVRPWNELERRSIAQAMTRIYDQFANRVTQGRPGIDLSKTAEGRLFVADKAIDLKMADKVGGLAVTIEDMAAQLGLAPGSYDVIDYPPPPTLEDLLKGFGMASAAAPGAHAVHAAAAQTLRELLGPQQFDHVAAGLTALFQLRKEPVILATPRVLLFK
ncbi:MAG: S49 family peptidase [Planctomycetota bacterium]|nr:S49 family peptidase [Planctomycetota bacterium]